MMNVNKWIFLLTVFVIACRYASRPAGDTSANRADTAVFKLALVPDSVEGYYFDANGKNTILLTTKICSGTRCFGGTDSIPAALKYARAHPGEPGTANLNIVTIMSIKKEGGSDEAVWQWNNPVNLNEEGYSIREVNLALEEGTLNFQNRHRNCLRIIFKQPDEGDGFKMYILTLLRLQDRWALVSRERLNTMRPDPANEKFGYCKDTINSNCLFARGKLVFSNECLFELSEPICY